MNRTAIRQLIRDRRSYFSTGITKELSFRREQLLVLKKAVKAREHELFRALKEDLHKPPFEAYGGESAVVINEIDYAVRHLRAWAGRSAFKRRWRIFPHGRSYSPNRSALRSSSAPGTFRSSSSSRLWSAPWPRATAQSSNHPLTRRTHPIPSRSSSGSISTPRSSPPSKAVRKLRRSCSRRGPDVIFFTGGVATGRIVMAAASRHLTPVTLELGGKNPCIVDSGVDLDITARRIVRGKFFNAGQSCVAVDSLLVDRSIKDDLLARIAPCIDAFYGGDLSRSPDLARIVNEAHFDRLMNLLGPGDIIVGDGSDRSDRYIAPTVIDNITGSELLMKEEILVPILPVIAYDDLSEAIDFVNARPKPLALCFFSRDRVRQERVLVRTSSGGACINDTTLHETVPDLPFGGVGNYHSKDGFDAFSHQRSIMRNNCLLDVFLHYPPYRDHLTWVGKLL